MTWTPRKMRWWYDAVIDLMLAQPELKLPEIAQKLNKNVVTLRLIVKSDVFRAELQRRRDDINETLGNALKDDMLRIAKAGTSRILEELESPSKVLPLNDVVSITDKTLERMGYGVKPQGGQAPVEVNIHTVSAETLQRARGVLRTVEESKRLEPPSPQLEHENGHTIDSHDYTEIEGEAAAAQEVSGGEGMPQGGVDPRLTSPVAEPEAEDDDLKPEGGEEIRAEGL